MNQTSIFGTWDSNWGSVTFTGSPQHVQGRWELVPNKVVVITRGIFNPTTRTLVFTYYQTFNSQPHPSGVVGPESGVAKMTLSEDGLKMEGTWQNEGDKDWIGRWVLDLRR